MEWLDATSLISNYGYIGIFLVVILETALIFPLPGDTLLITAGLLASTGILSLPKTILIIAIASILGGVLGYVIGLKLERLLHFSIFKKLIKQEYLNKAEEFYAKHSHVAFALGRFVPIVRTFVSIVAGIIKMNYVKFLQYSILGAFIWSILMTSFGYIIGKFIPWFKDYLNTLMLVAVLFAFAPLFIEFVKIFFRKKK